MANKIWHNGVVREMTPEEIAQISVEKMEVWHVESCNVRITFEHATYKDNLLKLIEHEKGLADRTHLASLYGVFSTHPALFKRVDNGFIYFYCNFVYEEDEAIIRNYGGSVEKIDNFV